MLTRQNINQYLENVGNSFQRKKNIQISKVRDLLEGKLIKPKSKKKD